LGTKTQRENALSDLTGKSIIITGGGSGIGAAVSAMIAEAGGRVTVVDMNEAAAYAVSARINEAGGQAQACRADVSNHTDVQAMVEKALALYGRLDGACNAAGVPQRGKLMHEVSLEEWDLCHKVNLRGLFLCNKYQVIAMLKSGGGSIVNIASTAAMVGFPNGAEYCASKAGVMGLVRGSAIDYATKGIRINAVLPGGTRTPMLEAAMKQDSGLEAALAAVHPMGRFGQPREIASAVRWLLSDDASFVTGAAIPVDGGHTAI
jgi:NAD(P)-dependent dehydrogenase (short-subunit alcohol dehydrogenase family)